LLKIFALSPAFTAALIVIGVLLAFFGRAIFHYLIFILGGLVIGGGLALVAMALGQSAPLVLGVGIIGFVIGGLIAIFLLYLALFVTGAYIGYLMGTVLFPNSVVVPAIIAMIFGVFLVVIFKAALPIFTAIEGGALVGLALLLNGAGYSISATAALVIIVLGAAYQLLALRKSNVKTVMAS
jgi:hypothetical protein